jgi:hypothetical protein
MIGRRLHGLAAWLVFWGFRFKPVTHRQAWLNSAAMALPTTGLFYALTAISRVLLGTPSAPLTFLIIFPIYMCVVMGAASSWKVHRG